MGQLGRRRPSAALVVAIIALVVAASGTALAARRLVSGDSLIRKHSLSGNRLRNATITGRQVNLGSLGQVPSAKSAADAGTLDGRGPGAFESASNFSRSGLVTVAGNQTAKLAGFGPFTVTLKCNDNSDGTFDAEVDVSSSSPNSEVFGSQMTPGTPQEISDAGPDSAFNENFGGTLVDFVAPPQAYMAYLIDAVFMPGTSTPCAASLLVGKS